MFLKKPIYLLVLITFCVFQVKYVYGFEKFNSDSLQLFYILDDVQYPGVSTVYKHDNSPSYIQVVNNTAIIRGRFTNVGPPVYIMMYGIIDGLKKSKLANGDQFISFYIRGRQASSGLVRSLEITITKDNKINIHFFNKLGLWETYLTAHKASKDEIMTIQRYWADRDY